MSKTVTAKEARLSQNARRLERYKKLTREAPGLAAPEIPGLLDPDNLVPASLLENGLTVNIPQWNRVLTGDVVELTWSGGSNSSISVTIDDAATQEFPIPVSIGSSYVANDGVYNLYYRVVAATGSSSLSESVTILINRTPPNYGNRPQALQYPADVINGGITSEYLAAHDDQVIATVPGYPDIAVGQVVHAVWNGSSLLPVTVTDADVQAAAVSVVIPGDTIRESGEGHFESHYSLTSRAGFDGLESDPATVDVILIPEPADLKAPAVPLAADGLIDLEDADKGVALEIETYSNARTGDEILASWGETKLGLTLVVQSDALQYVDVPRRVILSEGTGTLSVSYQVIRDGRIYKSPETDVIVNVDRVGPDDPNDDTPVNEALEPPVVTGSSGSENELLPEDAGKAASVTVPFYDTANAGEIITVYWGQGADATPLAPHTVAADDISNKAFPDFTVAADVVDATANNPEFPVYYTLGRAEEPHNPVLSPAQPVNVFLKGPSDLGPVTFVDINNVGWLLKENVENGCNVRVEVYNNMAAGDTVALNWQAFSTTNAAAGTEIEGSAYTASKTVGAPELAAGVLFTVPYETYIDAIAGASTTAMGSGQVQYTVTQSGVDFAGETAFVQIDLGAP